MASSGQLTGMRGVYLVAAEFAKRGFIASPTSRSAAGADILVTDQACKRTYSVQVKTNAKTFNFWLLSKSARDQRSCTHYYFLVNIRHPKSGEVVEYYVIPSFEVAGRMVSDHASTGSKWNMIYRKDVEEFRDAWEQFGTPN